MRISDWSSDVCSSDLVVDYLLARLRAVLLEHTEDLNERLHARRRSHSCHSPPSLPGSNFAGTAMQQRYAHCCRPGACPRDPLASLQRSRRGQWVPAPSAGTTVKIGRAHVLTPVTNAHLVCRLLLEKKKTHI